LRNQITLFIIIILLLNSCATLEKKQKNYQFDSTNEQGLFLATITLKKNSSDIDVLDLEFEDYDVHDKNWFLIDLVLKNNRMKADTIINEEKIYYLVAKTSVTKYKLSGYEIIKELNPRDEIKSKTNQISIPFEIEKGIVNYIGDFNFYLNKNENGFHFEIQNNLDRDIAKLKKMYPKVEWGEIKNQLLKSESDIIEF
tara:strand:+ start:25 stop:618 length:594 start_codon:yes stop_codon:yes gene_type:complete